MGKNEIKNPNLKKNIFTFGLGHKYPNGYVVIYALSSSSARELMFKNYGNKWAFHYLEDLEEEFLLRCIRVIIEDY